MAVASAAVLGDDPGPHAAPASLGAVPFRLVSERVGYGLFALFVFFTCFTFLRPSPYDFAAIPAMLVWFLLGIRLHRGAVVFLGVLILYHVGLITALIPYLDEAEPSLWTFQSVYLMATCVFFVMFFSDETERRFDLAANAYLASCAFAALCGIVSYFVPAGPLFTMDGRAAGVFQDPNLLGSFLHFGVLIVLRRILVGGSRTVLLSGPLLLLLLGALFLSFSRGAWIAMAVGVLLTMAFTFRSSLPRIRRRMTVVCTVGLVVASTALAGLLAVPGVADTFADRFTLSKDYDEGVTGRFGNQLRSIPLLVEEPGGFGPLRFRLRYGIEPHNSYIGGFANGGWLGGLGFLGMVFATMFVGLRLCLVASPYQGRAQVVVPVALMMFIQALQIDIDHWRHVYLVLGIVWGLECARLRWTRQDPRRLARPAPDRAAFRGLAAA